MTAIPPGSTPRDPGHDPTLIGAYLLGALDADEAAAVERHLAECTECRDELAELQDLPELLHEVDLDDLGTGPVAGDELFSRVAAAIDDDRLARHRHRARLALAGAAAAVVAAGGAVAGVTLTGGSATPGQTFSASSGRMHMTLTVSPRNPGTALAVHVSGLPENEHCRLIAVSSSGARQVTGSWTASYSGSAQLSGLATSFRPAQLSEVILQLSNSGQRLTVHT